MAKFNKKVTVSEEIETHPDKTENYEGGATFVLSDKEKLYQMVSTCLCKEPNFYGADKDTEIIRLVRKVAKIDPEFVLKLAYYTRKELYLRSIPIVLLAEAANINEAKKYIRKYAKHIISRADEPKEVIAYCREAFGISKNNKIDFVLPNSLKKGINDSLNNFDEYQYEKWQGGKSIIKYSNVLKLCHPKPTGKAQEALFNYLLYDDDHKKAMPNRLNYLPIIKAKQELMKCKEFDAKAKELSKEAHATWEVLISVFGHGNQKKEVWEAVIDNWVQD